MISTNKEDAIFKSINSLRRLAPRWVLLAAFLALAGCSEREIVDIDYLCTPQTALDIVCGLQSPEDAEWLPDGSGLIISEYGAMGETEGRLTLMEIDSHRLTYLYDSQNVRANVTGNLWGDAECQESSYFSPHGISLSQRPSGRWQLLVVNHAEVETIEFFELKQIEEHWFVEWRGCVEADDDSLFNDVTAAARGFYVTRFAARGSTTGVILDYLFKRKGGIVKRWSIDKDWETLEDTAGTMLNGILWNADANELVVNQWGNSRVAIYDGKGNKKREFKYSFPDNVSWDGARKNYLIASKGGSFYANAKCTLQLPEHCSQPFSIVEITPNSDDSKIKYESDGRFFGASTNAVEKDGKLYIGSFTGSRLLIADVHD